MVAFCNNKRFQMLKLGFALPNLAKICPNKSTTAKFHHFTANDKDLLRKIREEMVGGPTIVITRKTVVNEIFIRDSSILWKSIVGIDASLLHAFSLCQAMPTGLYTK